MRQLYRSSTNKVVAGVFGGLGEMYHVDPNILRLAYVLLTMLTGFVPLVIAYLVAWAIVPERVAVPPVTAA